MRHLKEIGPPDWYAIALKYLGTKELVGGQLNPVIRRFFGSTHFPSDKITKTTPWCAAFVSFCLGHAGLPSPRTANAAKCGEYGRASELKEGAIVVLSPGVSGAGLSGHVGFYSRPHDDTQFWLLSGNCDNSVKEKLYPLDRVVAVRWPVV